VSDAPTVYLPLAYADRHLGKLIVWTQPGREGDQQLIAALAGPADALAQVISLGSPGGPPVDHQDEVNVPEVHLR
jgi:hypothetical protein